MQPSLSAKPQTTRRRQLGILTTETSQVIFVDTPGLHVPQHKLGDFMNQEAAESLHDADLVLWLVDVSASVSAEDKLIADRLNAIKKRPRVLMTLSKCDLVSEDTLLERKRACLDLFPPMIW